MKDSTSFDLKSDRRPLIIRTFAQLLSHYLLPSDNASIHWGQLETAVSEAHMRSLVVLWADINAISKINILKRFKIGTRVRKWTRSQQQESNEFLVIQKLAMSKWAGNKSWGAWGLGLRWIANASTLHVPQVSCSAIPVGGASDSAKRELNYNTR